jgi:hypothetical protein
MIEMLHDQPVETIALPAHDAIGEPSGLQVLGRLFEPFQNELLRACGLAAAWRCDDDFHGAVLAALFDRLLRAYDVAVLPTVLRHPCHFPPSVEYSGLRRWRKTGVANGSGVTGGITVVQGEPVRVQLLLDPFALFRCIGRKGFSASRAEMGAPMSGAGATPPRVRAHAVHGKGIVLDPPRPRTANANRPQPPCAPRSLRPLVASTGWIVQ